MIHIFAIPVLLEADLLTPIPETQRSTAGLIKKYLHYAIGSGYVFLREDTIAQKVYIRGVDDTETMYCMIIL